MTAHMTEMRDTHDAMRLSDELFRSFFDHSPVGIAIAALNGRYVRVNKAMCEFVGYSEAELQQLTWRDITHPDDLAAIDRECRQKAPGGSGAFQMEKRYVRKDGRTVWALMVVSVIRDPDGTMKYTLGQLVDINALKQKEADLLRSREQLRALAAHQETLIEAERRHIAGAVHDHLGQQLTALRMDIGLLRMQHQDDPVIQGYCTRMHDLADETLRMVRDIATALHPAEIELGLAPAILSLADSFQRRHGIPCQVSGLETGCLPPRDLAAMIYRVIQEALTNVVRHADAGQVEISRCCADGRCEITVADDGAGFDVCAALKGNTYGLFGMQERVRAVGGELRIESRPELGSAVTVSVPLGEP